MDKLVLNTLRSEPASMGFDFFSYGGLTRTTLEILQALIDSSGFFPATTPRSVSIPFSEDMQRTKSGRSNHTLVYTTYDGIDSILANAYNLFSDQSDSKIFGTIERDIGGEKYQFNFLALEVYRGKGNGHPIWELGFYVTRSTRIHGEREIVYSEEAILDVCDTEKTRLKLLAESCNFISSLSAIGLPPPSSEGFHYLNHLINSSPEIRLIPEDEFEENKARWFRYLTGTLDVKTKVKLEDYTDPSNPVKYRVELIKDEGLYRVLMSTDDKAISNREKELEDGPFPPDMAAECFLETATHYLDMLYERANSGERQFEVALNPQRIDLRYAASVRAEDGVVFITSWESPIGSDGRMLPPGQTEEYIQIFGKGGKPLRLDQGINFPANMHPRDFMDRLKTVMPNIHYGDGSTLIEQAQRYGLPLMNPVDNLSTRLTG